MKILFVTHKINDADGRTTLVKYASNALASHGINVHVLTTSFRENQDYKEQEVCYHNLKTGDGGGFLRIIFYLLKFSQNFDLVEYHPPAGTNILNIFGTALVGLIVKLRSTPITLYLWGGPSFFAHFKFLFSGIIIPEGFNKHCLTISPGVNLEEFNFKNKDKFFLGNDGVKNEHTVLFLNGAKEFSEDIFKYILFKRGLMDIVLAASKLKDQKIKFIIGVPALSYGSGKKKILELLEKYSILDNFIILGKIEEIQKLIASADIYVFPHAQEEELFVPLSILESMASGTVVIASKWNFTAQIFQDEQEGLLYRSRNSSELAKKILQALKLKKSISRKAQQKIKTFYNINSMADKLAKEFKKIICHF